MSSIQIGNKIISDSLLTILYKLKQSVNGSYLKDIKETSNGIRITCPFHSDGQEKNPDCVINDDPDSNLYGIFHCFACGAKGYITDIINKCFNQTGTFAQEWLLGNFNVVFIEQEEYLPEIFLDQEEYHSYLDPREVDKYKYFHPYMFQRKLTEDVIRKFSVGYDEKDDSIVFPVWDEKDNLLFFTKRSVKSKAFYIPRGVVKPIYLLNYIIKEHQTTVYVVESQINALTLWSWGYPAIALFGTGSKEQYEILRKSGIRNYILCFDGDGAGDNGCKKFIENMNDDILISIKKLPRGKDVNDLTKNEFDLLEQVDF